MRRLAAFSSMLLSCTVATPLLAGGTIDIQTTSFDNWIVVDITIVDDGGSGGCNGTFTLRREAIPTCSATPIATIQRQPGSTTTHRIIDGPLPASGAYCYEVLACSGFTWSGDCGWGLPISVCATTTPAPAFLGTGRLENGVAFYDCRVAIECGIRDVFSLPPDGWQYVGTNTDVAIYGGFDASCQNGWLFDVTSVVPSDCTVAVQPSTWSQTKTMYR